MEPQERIKKRQMLLRPIQVRLSVEEFNELIRITEDQGFSAFSTTARIAIKKYIKEQKVS